MGLLGELGNTLCSARDVDAQAVVGTVDTLVGGNQLLKWQISELLPFNGQRD